MQQLNKRQYKIIDFLSEKKLASNSEITAFLGNELSRFTVLRDLDFLLEKNIIKKQGRGRAVKYGLSSVNSILSYIDPIEYFKKGPDERNLKFDSFNQDIFNWLPDIFSKEEKEELNTINNEYVKRIKKMNEGLFKKEVERITIELSWKSSQIEGNTYSLIDTEMLIKKRIEAKGHNKEEAMMILNHKNAIDYIFNNKSEFKKLDLFQIEKIHELLTRGMGIKTEVRSDPVRITGTKYRPTGNRADIINYLHKTIDMVNSIADPFSKALIAILMVSYIQPFEDGNKRTARILGNAILLANNVCPLSYRSAKEADYKSATILFYEQNSAVFFKELFIEQFKFAVDNYF
jgi:Fic family protein